MMTKNKQNQEIKQLNEKIEEMDTNWKRALADYANLEKRTRDQQQLMAQLATLSLIEKLLPLMDNLSMAAGHLKDPGIDMIVKQLDELLTSEGVGKIETIDQVFNPAMMECVELVNGQKDIVCEVILPGFTLGNRVIRPAKVKVGNGKTK